MIMSTLVLSKWAIERAIIQYEVGWNETDKWLYYNNNLSKPTVPAPDKSDSGVTIGIGYDCGYNTRSQIIKDWSSILPADQVKLLADTAGLKKYSAVSALSKVKHIKITVEQACQVFYNTTLHKFALQSFKIYPALLKLHPIEQTVFIGLIYNRGNKLEGERRREMKLLVKAIERDNDKEMGSLIRAMKRLWPDVKGLRIRRDKEASLIELPDTPISESDKLIINLS